MSAISDFDKEEIQSIRWGLDFRWRNQDLELHLADVEADLSDGSTSAVECPAVFWRAEDCNFVLLKTGKQLYRGKFFYEPHEQHGTHIPEYDDIKECVIALLQIQADHHSVRAGVFPPSAEQPA